MKKFSLAGLLFATLFLFGGLLATVSGIRGIETGTGVLGKSGTVSGRQSLLFGIGLLVAGTLLLLAQFRSRSKNGDDEKS
jgi:hypothetical protein